MRTRAEREPQRGAALDVHTAAERDAARAASPEHDLGMEHAVPRLPSCGHSPAAALDHDAMRSEPAADRRSALVQRSVARTASSLLLRPSTELDAAQAASSGQHPLARTEPAGASEPPRLATAQRDASYEPPRTQDPNAPLRAHGGLRDAELHELGLAAHDILDFSTSCNPYGPCLDVLQAVRTAPLERYPDPSAHRARVALASSLDAAPAQLLLGNGAAELLWSTARALLAPGSNALIVEPTFCEFRVAAERSGARLHEWRATPSSHFAIDLAAVLQRARSCAADLIYLCTPNTPAGTALSATAIARAASAHPQLHFILDQSFLSLSARWADASCDMPPNVIRIRSLTKEQGIPGVRIGYLLAEPERVARIERERPAWTTGAHAQAAAIAAATSQRFVARSRERLLHARIALECGLTELGLTPEPSSAGFLIVRTGAAAALRDRLLRRHHILVRDCSSFGLPDFIRLAARPQPELDRLLRALHQELTPAKREAGGP